MSRVGAKPVSIPAGVTAKVVGSSVSVKGPKGDLSLTVPRGIEARVNGSNVDVSRTEETPLASSLHGLVRTLIMNMVVGVTSGYSKDLEVEGVGFKIEMKGKQLVMALGFSHPVVFDPPAGITITAKGNAMNISGPDKQLVGDVAARIRLFKPPEPYKGKGIRYRGERIRRKAGKTVA